MLNSLTHLALQHWQRVEGGSPMREREQGYGEHHRIRIHKIKIVSQGQHSLERILTAVDNVAKILNHPLLYFHLRQDDVFRSQQ
jgi:hypothetical protein